MLISNHRIMFWKRRSKSDNSAQLERIKEVARRAGIMTRGHLELLRHEGALSQEDVNRIVAAHSRTVAQQPPHIQVPTVNQQAERIQGTYTETIRDLLARIAQSFAGWENTLQRLDPMKQSPFRSDDREEVASDLIAAVLLMRNQSLFSLFSEEEALAIEAKSYTLIHSLLDQQRGQLYDLLKRQWLDAVATDEVPQQVLSATLLHRSFSRQEKQPQENPLLEMGMSEELVNTAYFYWPLISNGVELKAG